MPKNPPCAAPAYGSAVEAAALISRSVTYVYRLLNAGLIESQIENGRRRVNLDSARAYRQRLDAEEKTPAGRAKLQAEVRAGAA